MTEYDLTITLTIYQPSLQIVQGTITPPSFTATITFGKWIKGDKGDKGDTGETGPQGPEGPQGPPGVGIPQNLSISGYDLSISSGNTVHLPEPSIPTVNDGILTIKENGTTIDTFSANESTDKTVDIQVPTSLSDLSDLFLDNVQNQQVLRYDSATGKWINADVSESNGVVFVKLIAEDVEEERVYSCDTPIADIVDAIESGKMVYCELPYPYIGYVQMPLFSYYEYNNTRMVVFLSNIGISTWLSFQGLSYYSDDTWSEDSWEFSEYETQLTNIGNVDASDPEEGQVLTYNGYRWENANPTGQANVQSDWNQSDNTADDFIKNKPTIPTVPTDVSAFNNDAGYATETYVNTAIENLPEPMVFKGSLGTGGTITTLPAASSSNEGFVYKVITDGTYASQAAKVGDTFISTGSAWVLIPSGDEPSGTVTSVGVSVPTGLSVNGTPVTSSGTIALSYASGYAIPTTTKQSEWDAKQNAINNNNKLSADYIQDGTTNKVINVKPDWNAASGADAEILNKPAIHNIPAGGNSGQVLKKTSATDYDVNWANSSETLPSAYCTTSGSTAAKRANCSLYVAQANQYLQVLIGSANTHQGALTLNINSAGDKPIYINGTASSSSNYTLPNGTYFVFYDGTNYYFRTDGKLPMKDTAFGGSYNDLANKPTIPAAVSGVDDGTNWTSITIGSNTKAIPSGGGGGGLTNHNFTHVANTTISTSTTTITFAANQRGSQMITVSADIGVTFDVRNLSDNYLWIKNSGNSDIDVSISSIVNDQTTISNVYVPTDGISVPAGKVCEIGIVCNADGAFITSRNDLTL